MRVHFLRLAGASALTLSIAPAALGCVFSHIQYKQGDELCYKHVHLQCGEMGAWKQLPKCDKDTISLPPPHSADGVAAPAPTPAPAPPAPDKSP